MRHRTQPGWVAVVLVCAASGMPIPLMAGGWVARQRVEFRNNIRLHRAEEAIQSSRYDVAREQLVAILEDSPEDLAVERMLIQVESALGAWEMAVARCDRLLRQCPDDLELRMSKAFLASKAGWLRVASEELELVLARTGDEQQRRAAGVMFVRIHLQGAQRAMHERRPEEAVALFRRYLAGGGMLTEYIALSMLEACVDADASDVALSMETAFLGLEDPTPDYLEKVHRYLGEMRRSAKN